MRYYSFLLGTNAQQITENAKIKLRDYSYDNSIAAMNAYMLRNVKNDITFLAYREEDGVTYAAFSYDEQKDSFENVYDNITGLLEDAFVIKNIKSDPVEITSFEYMDYIREASRRDYLQMRGRIVETANLWIWDYYNNNPKEMLHYEYKESIIPEGAPRRQAIYDQGFLKELANIEGHENASGCKGNMVHYVISGKSTEAAGDMTQTLMQSLLAANRISSRRMDVISDIEPEVYKRSNSHLEEIIENNYGGVIVFNLSEKFGHDPVEYVSASDYIERLLKKYRNHCPFVFTYNMDRPGFSYMLLPKISRYVIPVMLREGSGDRKTAVKYLKTLIEDSEYAEYAGQAAEFMKLFPGNNFSQTDVLSVFERFGA